MSEARTAEAAPLPRRFTVVDQFLVSCLWLAYNVQWGAMIYVVLPEQVLAIVGPDKKELYNGLVAAVGAAVALVITPIAGALSDRSRSPFGRRRPFLLTGALLDILFLMLLAGFGRGSNIWLFALCFMGVQFGCNWMGGPYAGLIPDVVPEHQRGTASGWMAVMQALGSITGATAAGVLIKRGGFGPAYLFIAAAIAVTVGLTLWGVREKPNTQAPEPFHWGAFWRSFLLDPRKYRDFYWVMITRAMVTMGVAAVGPFFNYFLTDIIKVSDPAGATVALIGTVTLMSIPTSLFAGSLSDRLGRKPLIYLSGGVMAAASIVFIAVGAFPSLSFTLAVAAVFGLGYGAYMAVDWALGIDVLPAGDDAAKDMGIWHASMVLPQMIAPVITGTTLNAFKSTSLTAGYTAVFVLMAIWFVLGTVFVRQVRGVR